MANRIQLRRGGAQEWANANPTLAQGELGIELDTTRFKIGDGVTAWNTLTYVSSVESNTNTANTLVKRDADGNFAAGTITATLIGQASTASRLASTRQVQLTGDVTGTDNFDGSDNINLQSQLSIVDTLAHYDGTNTSTGTYTQVEVDAKGRIKRGFNPTTLADYGLDTGIEGTGAQPYDSDLQAISQLNTTGLIVRTSPGNAIARTINGTASQVVVNNGGGLTGNPVIDLAVTTVVAGDYNTESLTSVSALGANNEPFGTETVNAAKFTVDDRGRLQSATNVPIATATEGSKYASYNAGTTYSRYDIIEEGGNVYQALATIAAGGGAPSHTSGDTGQWRYLAAAAVEQKGLASFAQEDFDVDGNGHVTIAALGVDNTQLQNNRISFADGNTKEDFELDQELTSTSGYRGFNYLNYIKVNDTSGNLLFGANNTGDSGAGEIDVNVRSYFSDPDITLDGGVNQTLAKTGNGDLIFHLDQNTGFDRNLSILSTNGGSGTSTVTITAEDVVDIDASDANGKVHIENSRFQGAYIATTDATMNLDPGDDRAVTGTVRVWGDLQVDGTTTTVNSTTLQVDDPIITLGGDTAPASDDNLDRGVEFRYYDTQARLGFYGWDTNYTDLGGHEGGYRFLHAATNTSEVFTGTDSGIIAGNVKLTTNTNSTSNTTGDLVVAGGAGIGQDVNIGGLLDVDGTFRANSTSRFDDTMVLRGASKSLQFQNGTGTVKTEIHTTSGNAEFGGVVTVTGNTDLNSNLNVASAVHFESTDEPTYAQNGGTGVWEIQSNDYGAFRFDGGGYVEGDFMFNSDVVINGTILQRDSATEEFNEQNFVRVRRKLEAGSTQALTPNYASHSNSNLRVFGGAGIMTDLYVGDDFYIGKLNSGDSVSFSVLGESGNTDIQGTLDVAGNTEINGTLDVDADFAVRNGTTDKFFVDNVTGNTVIEGTLNVNGVVDVDADFAVRNGTTDKFFVDNVTGNTNIQGTLDVNGATEITNTLDVSNAVTFDQTLLVQGNSEFNGTVDVDANFAVRSGSTDKFTVASSSGNVATDGTLVVQGQTTINDSLIVDAANEIFSIRNGSAVEKFGVDADNGNTNIIGTLTVGGATQINDTLGVSDVVTFTRNTQQSISGNSITLDGAVRMSGGLGVTKNLAVGEDLMVYGDFNIVGNQVVNGTTTYNAKIDITNTAQADSLGDNNVAFQVDGGGIVRKKLWAGGDFTVYDDANNRNAFFVDVSTGDAELHNNLTVGGDLTVNGTTTTVNSTVTTLDDPIITLGGDTAPASNDGKDRGVEFRYYDGSAKIGFFGFDRSAQQFTFLTDATNTSEVHAGTDAPLRAGSLNLTGAGTSLDVDANANIDGTLTVDGQIISQVTSGPALVIPTTNKINNLNADLLDSMTTASANTASTVVNRDSSGNFSAGTITAALTGNASTATTLETARQIDLDGVVAGSVSFDGSANVTISTTYSDDDITALAAMAGTGLVTRTAANTYAQRSVTATASSGITITNADGVAGDITINVASTSTNASNNLVLRDASGDFAANEITADLVGNVTGNVTGTVTSALITVDRLIVSSGASNILQCNADATFGGDVTIDQGGGFQYNAPVTGAFFRIVDWATQNTTFSVTPANGNVSCGTITGSLVGNVTGNITGNVTGNVTGDLTGDVTGNVTGNVTGDLTGDVTGNVDGNVSGEVTLEGAAPASATATGTAGDIRYDADYIYICVATNTWKRAAISTWS